MGLLGTESAFEVLAKARALEAAGVDVVHLEIGEPDAATPSHIVGAGQEALARGLTHYVPAPGTPELRAGVAAFLERTGRLRTSPDRVVVTPGAKPIMFFTILALCQAGDEVLYPDPGFPMYESIAAFAGARPVPVPLREANAFRMDPAELASLVTDRTRLVILNSPHNPCGSGLTQDDVEAIAAVAIEHDLVVLSDEVYWAIRYGGGHPSVLSVDGMAERTVLLDGWSKTFAMTGWRLGYACGPVDLIRAMARMQGQNSLNPSSVSQAAGVAALNGPMDIVKTRCAEFEKRRNFIVPRINAIPGLACEAPHGAFYVYVSCAGWMGKGNLKDDSDVTAYLLEHGVALPNGASYGLSPYFRVSFASSLANLEEACKRMDAAARELS